MSIPGKNVCAFLKRLVGFLQTWELWDTPVPLCSLAVRRLVQNFMFPGTQVTLTRTFHLMTTVFCPLLPYFYFLTLISLFILLYLTVNFILPHFMLPYKST